MSHWKYTLDVKDLWKDHGDKLISDQELCTLLAGRIRRLEKKISHREVAHSRYRRKQLLIIADHFERLENFDYLDDLLDTLYNWADHDHICWIKTF